MKLRTRKGDEFNTYLAGPEDAKIAILLIHDWWGVKEYNRRWAERFAELGYHAMVIDLYDGYLPTDAQDAGDFMRELDQDEANSKMSAAIDYLNERHAKVAVLGWSFGGMQAQYATYLDPSKVAATIIYYCRIVTDEEEIEALEGPMLAIFSEAERTWPDKQKKLEQLMSNAGKSLECHSFPADHGFANPDSVRYNAEFTESSWKLVTDFLKRKLG